MVWDAVTVFSEYIDQSICAALEAGSRTMMASAMEGLKRRCVTNNFA